jgi:hypothetical protein
MNKTCRWSHRSFFLDTPSKHSPKTHIGLRHVFSRVFSKTSSLRCYGSRGQTSCCVYKFPPPSRFCLLHHTNLNCRQSPKTLLILKHGRVFRLSKFVLAPPDVLQNAFFCSIQQSYVLLSKQRICDKHVSETDYCVYKFPPAFLFALSSTSL